MSLDLPLLTATAEARRQLEICNACRYCEGYCAVFPAMTLHRAFSDGEVTQLANLCHNCRGCYYACQFTAPHEFDLNLPRALAEVRTESWEDFIAPAVLSRAFQRHGVALVLVLAAALAALTWAALALRPASGPGFYAYLSHAVMASIFLPSFLVPLGVIAFGLRRYWRTVGGAPVRLAHLARALADAGNLKNLSGNAAGGCNYEQTDRYSQARRHAHQAVMWGFLLCFASTSAGTVMHYALAMPAPYSLLSLPKLLGIPGGVLMVVGGVALIALKARAERHLSAPALWGGEMAFVLLLTLVATSGLALFGVTGTGAVRPMLVLHLASVLALFLTLPYSKMVHAAFRLAALVRDAQTRAP